ncbi:UNVERIFIED_CONTAM: hypothetical protein FKN15_066188 [Acipenser sinensis]
MTIEGEPPKKKERESLVGMLARPCYDKWRDMQKKMRMKDVIGLYKSLITRNARCAFHRRSVLNASVLDAGCFSTPRQRSVRKVRTFGASTSTVDVMSFHHCVTCQAKLPASDPHDDCVACLDTEHATSALVDKGYCSLCARFQTRTLRHRAKKAVGGHLPSSGLSHTVSAPPSSTATPPVRLRPSTSPSSQLPAPSWERSRRESGSRSRLPSRRGRSRSPRRDRRYKDRSGVAKFTSKMSEFMDMMIGQQSLLMSLTNVTPRAPEQPGPIANQPVDPIPPLQLQAVWDIDAVSIDTSDVEPLLEEDSIEAVVASQHSEQDIKLEILDTSDPIWSVVDRATHHFGVEWPEVELPRCSLFESPSAQPLQSRMVPAFPDFIKEVQSTWGALASASATSHKASAFTMQGACEAGLELFPPVDAAFTALVRTPTLSGLTKDPACPNKQCRITEVHLKKGYAAATEAVRLSNVASLLTVYQATLIRDLPE